MNVTAWLEQNTRSLSGRTVAVTGSTGGLGRELCRYLLALDASLILLDRSRQRSDERRAELLAEFPTARIEQIPLDLADFSSVCAACERLEQLPLDVLVHNAGAYSIPRCRCDTGYDNVFQINFAAPYYMTRRLLPHLRRRGAHVVAVGSIAHRYSKTDGDDVDFSTRRRASLVYGNAKRYLMFALQSLFENEGEATLSVVHPGITLTGITAHYPKVVFALIKYPMKLIFPSPRAASLSLLRGVLEPTPSGKWIGPRLADVWGRPALCKLRGCSKRERERISACADSIWLEWEQGYGAFLTNDE